MEISEALRSGVGVTVSEALSEGAKVTGLGLMIVFSVLIILMIVLYLFKLIFYKKPAPVVQSQPQPQAPAVVEAPTVAPSKQNDDELIAVLTAAIAASLNTTTYNLKIKSYKRISSNATAWQKAGRTETINNRY